jgi:hypothetical protein
MGRKSSHMLADHVETKVLEHFDVIHHGLMVGRSVQTVGPVTLIESTELEDELAIQQVASDALDLANRDGTEASVAVDLIIAQGHGEVVQGRRVGPPKLDAVDGEGELLISRAGRGANFRAIQVKDGDLNGRVALSCRDDVDSDCATRNWLVNAQRCRGTELD